MENLALNLAILNGNLAHLHVSSFHDNYTIQMVCPSKIFPDKRHSWKDMLSCTKS